MGVITTKKSLVQLEQLPVAAFCRRRLAVVAVRLKMAQSIKEAATYVEQGHIRVGPGEAFLELSESQMQHGLGQWGGCLCPWLPYLPMSLGGSCTSSGWLAQGSGTHTGSRLSCVRCLRIHCKSQYMCVLLALRPTLFWLRL